MHTSVLLNEAIDGLNITSGATIVDGTLGLGGHTKEMVKRFGDTIRIIAIDQDAEAIEIAKQHLASMSANMQFYCTNYRKFDEVLATAGITTIDGFLIDLGLSSYQLESGNRGFSFLRDEPLAMTMATDAELTARIVVNTWQEETLADIIYGYGQEKFARKIAHAIVEAREKQSIETTGQLVSIIETVISRKGKIHPATRTFQALRIAVNDELGALDEGLQKAWQYIAPKGRIAVITFHSLEDRKVKHFFKSKKAESSFLTKKPIIPTREEIMQNPRARSAKLRIIEKQ